jgi:uncharacterized protein GlcG (DUF336 family)
MAFTVNSALDLVQSAIRVGGERGIPVAAAVVDAGGRLLASARSENAGFINLTIAERKAVAAINFKAPTHGVLDMIKADPILLSAVTTEPSLCVLPGGFPIVASGVVVGALGLAGGHYMQDQAVGEEVLKMGPKGE